MIVNYDCKLFVVHAAKVFSVCFFIQGNENAFFEEKRKDKKLMA
jgi:hypothetical protein